MLVPPPGVEIRGSEQVQLGGVQVATSAATQCCLCTAQRRTHDEKTDEEIP